MRKTTLFLIILMVASMALSAQDVWHKSYQQGVDLLNIGDYNNAIVKFQASLNKKPEDKSRVRTYGMHFIAYFPNREIGIAFYFIGNASKAEFYLRKSLRDEPSERAQVYLTKIKSEPITAGSVAAGNQNLSGSSGQATFKPTGTAPVFIAGAGTKNPETTALAVKKAKESVGEKAVERVGDRMTVAVFPFQSKGKNQDLGHIIMDKLTTALFNQDRFRVIERSQLERILAEQKLGMSGILDESKAAQLGKGIGVDAIILGSVAEESKGDLSIYARAIDTESAIIVVAEDAYAQSSAAKSVKMAVENLAFKLVQKIPLVDGMVISVEGDRIMIDKGHTQQLKEGMKCVVYKEGKEIKHPVSKKVLGREKIIIGEILITEVADLYSYAKVINIEPGFSIQVENIFVTK